jgi:hypothetical protein
VLAGRVLGLALHLRRWKHAERRASTRLPAQRRTAAAAALGGRDCFRESFAHGGQKVPAMDGATERPGLIDVRAALALHPRRPRELEALMRSGGMAFAHEDDSGWLGVQDGDRGPFPRPLKTSCF